MIEKNEQPTIPSDSSGATPLDGQTSESPSSAGPEIPNAAEIDKALQEAIGDTPSQPVPPPRTPTLETTDLEAEIENALAGVDLDLLADEGEKTNTHPWTSDQPQCRTPNPDRQDHQHSWPGCACGIRAQEPGVLPTAAIC